MQPFSGHSQCRNLILDTISIVVSGTCIGQTDNTLANADGAGTSSGLSPSKGLSRWSECNNVDKVVVREWKIVLVCYRLYVERLCGCQRNLFSNNGCSIHHLHSDLAFEGFLNEVEAALFPGIIRIWRVGRHWEYCWN